MRRFLHPNVGIPVIIGLILLIVGLFFSIGIFGPNGSEEPTPPSEESIIQTEDGKEEESAPRDPIVEEDPPLLPIEEEIAEAQATDPTENTEPVPGHEHAYGATEILPSCTREGYTLYECSCGDSYTKDIKEMLPHQYTSKVIAPTEGKGGYTLYTCSNCGKEYKDNETAPITKETKPTDPSVKETTAPTEPEVTESKPTETPKEEQPDPSPNVSVEDEKEEDYGICPKCGRKLWTTNNPTGCFTFLTDTECDCGEFVRAMECHHH